jgi:hypothetical protein
VAAPLPRGHHDGVGILAAKEGRSEGCDAKEEERKAWIEAQLIGPTTLADNTDGWFDLRPTDEESSSDSGVDE